MLAHFQSQLRIYKLVTAQLVAFCNTDVSYVLKELKKHSRITESGILILEPRRAVARQGEAIRSGKTPAVRYACEITAPNMGNACILTQACVAGYKKDEPSKSCLYTCSKNAVNASLDTPPASIASSPLNLTLSGY